MKYFLSAGEASGDLHAARLMAALWETDPEARFVFLGGDLMADEAGAPPVIHYRDMAYMGFVEVVRHLPQVLTNLSRAKEALTRERPDALILVDYPSFNLKLAARAHELGIPVFYYISPKVWAWKEWRVKQIRRLVRHVYCILPFEVEFYRDRHGVDVTYVGNPSVEEVEEKLSSIEPRKEFLKRHNLPDLPIIALVPGSRRAEIRTNLAIMQQAARELDGYQLVVAGAPGIDPAYYGYYVDPGIPVIAGATFELMRYAEAALVTSGTATLECALLDTPQVVCYRSSGSRLVYAVMSKVLKIPFVSLPNLIAGRAVVPELLMHRCTSESVGRALRDILPGTPGRDNQLEGYRTIRRRLGNSDAAATTASLIVDSLKRKE